MEQARALFKSSGANSRPHPGSPTHKDKLLQTKLREKELKEAVKEKKQMDKEAKELQNSQTRSLLKEERLEHDTKRAAKDKRESARREHHAETGQMCEHGVWRCKICFPHKAGK